MLATPYEIGRFIGVVLFGLLIPALLTWWAIGLRQRSSGVWWIHLAVGVFVSMSILLGPVIRANGDLRRDEKPNPARVDAETVFANVGTYRFQAFTEQVQASVERVEERSIGDGSQGATRSNSNLPSAISRGCTGWSGSGRGQTS